MRVFYYLSKTHILVKTKELMGRLQYYNKSLVVPT